MAGGGIKVNYTTVRGGADGATFVPSIDTYGNLSWSNNKGYENPPTINLKSLLNRTDIINADGLVEPTTAPQNSEIVGIGTNGQQIRIQLGNIFILRGSASPYTLTLDTYEGEVE